MDQKPKRKPTARRGRGEGSVFQRADGLWVCTITVGHTPTGKRKRRTIYGKTKTEALAKLKQEQTDVAKGLVKTSTRGTVGELLTKWLEFAKSRVQPKTHARYKLSVDGYLMPLLGDVQLSRLTTEVIDLAMGKIAEGGKTCANPFTALCGALRQGRRWGLLAHNPCEDVTLPAYTPRDIIPLTKPQTLELLRLSQADRLHGLFVLLLTTGCRIGEALALHWDDIDFPGGRMRIWRTLEELSGKLRLKVTKTKASQRTVLLPSVTVDALLAHRERMEVEGFTELPIVFPNTQGGFLRASKVLSRHWRPLVGSVGAPKARIHDARHTVATLLIAGGAPLKAVQGMLGHADPAITMRMYAKFSPELQEQTAGKMDSMLNGYKMATNPEKPVIDSTATVPETKASKRITKK